MTRKKPTQEAKEKPQAADTQAAATETVPEKVAEQETVTLTLPAYQALMIVGVSEEGAMFHHFAGKTLNVLSMVGLSKYMESIVSKLLGKALPDNIQKL